MNLAAQSRKKNWFQQFFLNHPKKVPQVKFYTIFFLLSKIPVKDIKKSSHKTWLNILEFNINKLVTYQVLLERAIPPWVDMFLGADHV